jgi:hypothetical protein
MPRPRKNNASPVFMTYPHRLSDAAKDALKTVLSNDDPAALAEIEFCLGYYVDGLEHVDEIPRAADYKLALTPIGDQALALLHSLTSLGGYFRDALTASGADVHKIELSIAELAQTSKNILARLPEQSPKGRKPHVALDNTTVALKTVFAKHYKGANSTKPQRGAFKFSSERDKNEAEFLQIALLDANQARAARRKTAGEQ